MTHTVHRMITRRQCNQALVAALASSFLPKLAWAKAKVKGLDNFTVWGGPATPSLPLIRLAESGALMPEVQSAQFKMFRSGDEVRAGVIGDGWPMAMVPLQMAAILHNRGMPVRFMTVLTWGLVYFVSHTKPLNSIEQLAGARVALTSKNNLFDEMFTWLVKSLGFKIGQDVHLSYLVSSVEAMQWLHAGKVDHVLIAEPECSAALQRNDGTPLYRGMNLGDLRHAVDGSSDIPLAGIMVRNEVIEQHPKLVNKFKRELENALAWTLANPLSAAESAEQYFSIPASIIAASVPHSRLVADNAKEHQARLDNYFAMIMQFNPAMIGDKIPDSRFYI